MDMDSQSQPGCVPAATTSGSERSAAGKFRNRPTTEGRQLGKMLAKWCDDAEPAARLRMPELAPRCNSCAFREGAHTANGSPETQMDALKCIMEGHEFLCHEPAREGHLCSGWAMMLLAKETPEFANVPWHFSDESAESVYPLPPPGAHKPLTYFCPACQAFPQVGYCRLAGCPTAPTATASPAERPGRGPGKPEETT